MYYKSIKLLQKRFMLKTRDAGCLSTIGWSHSVHLPCVARELNLRHPHCHSPLHCSATCCRMASTCFLSGVCCLIFPHDSAVQLQSLVFDICTYPSPPVQQHPQGSVVQFLHVPASASFRCHHTLLFVSLSLSLLVTQPAFTLRSELRAHRPIFG